MNIVLNGRKINHKKSSQLTVLQKFYGITTPWKHLLRWNVLESLGLAQSYTHARVAMTCVKILFNIVGEN